MLHKSVIKRGDKIVKRKVRKVGGSFYISITAAAADKLKIKEGDTVDVTTKGKSIVINKIDKEDKK